MTKFSELPTRYDPAPVESRWYQHSLEKNYFRAAAGSGRKSYTIVIPPPNVTGALHMGHALNNTLQDILIRWRRMQGFEALWVPGTDHAGVATQSVVEREIYSKEKKTRHDVGREQLLERIWSWKEKYGERILLQLRKLGSSCDWSRARFTMDEGLSKAVRQVFMKLYRDGLIYRGRYLVNWCPTLRTALADDEVEHKDVEGHLWHFKYPVVDDKTRFVTIATTRPETMLGDTAVAVHPDDDRYRDLVGKKLRLPLVSREIPVIADSGVDPEFGTGAVKVTPAHDPLDFEMGERHGLEKINILNEDGTINENGGRFESLDRFAARDEVVKAIDSEGLLEKIEPHKHSVGHCYRTGDVIEPYLSLQWFVKMKPLAEKAIAATKSGRVKFHPTRWTDYYLQWLENVRDWCISRQIWWGHRVPIWYGPDGTPFAGETEEEAYAEARAHYGNDIELTQDEDVLDTWFSSALWPFSTLGWPEKTADLESFFPTATLVTDRGIIFFWVARMVMMSEELLGREPFSDVYIHGTILDKQGRKMSKSLNNGIDPVALIEGGVDDNTGIQYDTGFGADAVRFSLTTISVEGQDLKLWPKRFEAGASFANKLWNAGRFSLLQLSGNDDSPLDNTLRDLDVAELAFEDRWILSRLSKAVGETTESLEGFRYCTAAQRIRDFVWNEFCDWYVEAIKPRLSQPETEAARSCRQVLSYVLDVTLRLLHPVCPFITEELWHLLGELMPSRGLTSIREPATESVLIAPWPIADDAHVDSDVERTFAHAQQISQAVRRMRQERNLSAKTAPEVTVSCASEETLRQLEPRKDFVQHLSSTHTLNLGVDITPPENTVSEILTGIAEVHLHVPEADRDKEIETLNKEREATLSYIEREEKKLGNENFVSRAPAQVVDATRQRVEEARQKSEAIQRKIDELTS